MGASQLNTDTAVTRYPFPVPEWARTQWASEGARALWEPRLSKINEAWAAAERASVGGVRAAALQAIEPHEMPALAAKAVEADLVALPLNQQRSGAQYQAGAAGPPAPGEPWVYRAALVTRKASLPFARAWRESDDEAIGRMLGYPRCCREFFARTWVEEGWIDTTWPMAQAAEAHEAPDGLLVRKVAGPAEANILLRWLGVRLVPWLPCAFDCAATAELGGAFRALLPGEVAEWIVELLEMPVEWSAWHGIAEIKTPLFTVSAKTDATAERLAVRRPGRAPEAGVRGLRFPYNQVPPEKSGGRGIALRFARHLPAPAAWEANGFASPEAMERAHDVVARAVGAAWAARPGDEKSVLDLGCGNGALLHRLAALGASRCVGVERDATRAALAREYARGLIAVNECDIWHFIPSDSTFGIALFMPGRMVESPGPHLYSLRSAGRTLVVYAYGDWLQRYGGLAGLCAAANFPGGLDESTRFYCDTPTGAREAEAAAWRWSSEVHYDAGSEEEAA